MEGKSVCGAPWSYNEPGCDAPRDPDDGKGLNYYCQLEAGHGMIHDWFCFLGSVKLELLELPENVHRHGKFRFDW